MARIEPAERLCARAAPPAALVLTASVLAFLAASTALAQDVERPRGGLFGTVGSAGASDAEDQPATTPEGDARDAGFRSTYITRSPEAALAGGADDGGVFGDSSVAEDPFGNAPLPADRPLSSVRAGSQTRSGAQDDSPVSIELDTTAERIESVERREAAEPLSRRIEAIEARDRAPEENPYAPLGLRLGSFIVRPSLEQGVAWTSNASSGPDGSAALLSETTLRLNAISDWSRHSAALNAYGTFRKTISGEEISDLEGGFDADLVLDFRDDIRGAASARYSLRPESATSPVELPPTDERPLRQTFVGSVGLEKAAGRFRFGLGGNVERQQFEDARLEGGGILSQRERDFVLTTAVLRAGYQISPALTPFLEAELGRRAYDLRDDSGYDRSANRFGARAGIGLDLGEKFFGEVSAGWLHEDIDDERLDSVSAASVSADLFWSPVRGTVVGLQASTAIEGATAPGEGNSVLYAGRLSVEREMRANLTGAAFVGAEWRDYAGSGDAYDLTLGAEVGVTYWLNRYAGLTGRARLETVRSDDAGRESETSSVFLGVRLQR